MEASLPIRQRVTIESIEIDVRQILNRIEELKANGEAPNALRLTRWAQEQFRILERSFIQRQLTDLSGERE
jgi:hypothetical protein